MENQLEAVKTDNRGNIRDIVGAKDATILEMRNKIQVYEGAESI